MATIAVSAILSSFQRMRREGWSFKLGVAKEGCVDCSGAFVYTYAQYNQSIYHGSNRIAREYVVELIPYETAKSQGRIIPGMAAFRSRQPGQSYYDLPDEYKPGGSHYNGDLTDYNHIGLVDEDVNYVLNAKNPFGRDPITDRWTHVARLKAVNYGISSGSDGSNVTFSAQSNGNGSKFGIFGWQGDAAKELINYIKNAAPTDFEYTLKQNSAEKFTDDLAKSSWSGYKIQVNSNIYNAVSEILKSDTGVTYQNMRAESDLNPLINNGISRGLTNQSSIIFYAYVCFREYTEFADYAASKCSGDSTLDNFYTALMEKFDSYSNNIKSEMKRVYEYLGNLESNGTLSNTINGGSDINTPYGSTPAIDYTLTGGDGSTSAAKYNNWWVYLSYKMGSTHLNPNEKQIWNAHRVYNELISQGYNRAAACGIIGNMQLESGLSPGALQSGKKSQLPNSGTKISTLTNNVILGWHDESLSVRGYGLGLIQWDSNTNNSPVGNTIASFAINNNMQWYDGSLQMLRLKFEYEHDKSGGNQPTAYSFWYPSNYKISGEGVTWKQYKTGFNDPEKCADIFRACRERSSGDKTGNARRRDNAKYWYNYFGTNPANPWDSGSALTNVTSSPVVATQTVTIPSSNGANDDSVKPPDYKQYDKPWGPKVFGPSGRPASDTYQAAGCSVTAMCNVVCVFGSSVKPDTIGNLAIEWGYRGKSGDGLSNTPEFFGRCASKYGFYMSNTYTVSGTAAYDRIKDILNNGANNKLAILYVKDSTYSKSGSGHFVVAYKMNGSVVKICDPGINNTCENGQKRQNASKSTIASAVKYIYVFSKR